MLHREKMNLFIRIIQIFYGLLLGLLSGVYFSFKKNKKNKLENYSVRGEMLCFTLERLGPTFIKLGQLLSSRPDLLDPKITQVLRRLQTKVRPISKSLVVNIIESSFLLPLSQIFLEFSGEPISCGSIAQVHKGRTIDGEEIAIKIKRPGLKLLIELDFKILYKSAKWIGRLKSYRYVPLVETLSELEQSLIAQLNFRQEAKNAQIFHENFKDHSYLKIPKIKPELCNDSVISMEYLGNLTDLNKEKAINGKKKKLALLGLRMIYKMIFIDGFIHADLHSGNIFFQENHIVLVDFGLTTSLNSKLRSEFREFFFAMATNNGPLCAKIIKTTAQSLPENFDATAFTSSLNEKLLQFSGQSVLDFEVAEFAIMLFEIQKEYRIRGTTSFTMTIVALLMFEGVLKQLDSEMDFQGEAIQFLLNLKDTQYTQEQRILIHQELRQN